MPEEEMMGWFIYGSNPLKILDPVPFESTHARSNADFLVGPEHKYRSSVKPFQQANAGGKAGLSNLSDIPIRFSG
jgi:hypothetical protein